MLDRIHKIAEIVAAAAIVGSLIFVGIQLKQNTSAMDAEQRMTAMNIWSQQGLAIATNENLAKEMERFTYPALKQAIGQDSGRRQVMAFVTVTMNTVENQHRQFLDGNISQEEWFNFRNGLLANMASVEAYAEYWKSARNIHSPEFAELVDELFLAAAETRRLYIERVERTDDT